MLTGVLFCLQLFIWSKNIIKQELFTDSMLYYTQCLIVEFELVFLKTLKLKRNITLSKSKRKSLMLFEHMSNPWLKHNSLLHAKLKLNITSQKELKFTLNLVKSFLTCYAPEDLKYLINNHSWFTDQTRG